MHNNNEKLDTIFEMVVIKHDANRYNMLIYLNLAKNIKQKILPLGRIFKYFLQKCREFYPKMLHEALQPVSYIQPKYIMILGKTLRDLPENYN